MDFRGFDSSVILILRGGILRPIGNLPESLSQAILVGIMLVGRLGVARHRERHVAVSALFATTANTETLNITILGVTFVPPLPVPKVTSKIVPFSKNNLTRSFHYTSKVEAHTSVCSDIRSKAHK